MVPDYRAPQPETDILIRAVRVDRPPTSTGDVWVMILMDSGAWRYETVPASQILTPNGSGA